MNGHNAFDVRNALISEELSVDVYLVDRMGKIVKPYRAKWAMRYGLPDRIRDVRFRFCLTAHYNE